MSDKIRGLASNIVIRKRQGVEPYILFLGAGASISSGCSNLMKIIDDVFESHDSTNFNNWKEEIEKANSISNDYGELKRKEINKKKTDRFHEIWDKLDHDTKYAILRKHLWENISPSGGYNDLAELIKKGYFKMVLSTNLDNLLEKVLNEAGWYQPDNFIVIVNNKDRSEEIKNQIESSRQIFKIVKLHGSLESPLSYAFTPSEIFEFEDSIRPSLSQIINQSLIVIGHSMQDRDICVLFEREGREIHFVNPSPPDLGSQFDNVLKVRGFGSIIEGENGNFNNFFRKLRLLIEKESKEKDLAKSVSSIEGFLKSVGYEHEITVSRSRYRNLQSLYVKSTEYDEICLKLEENHVIFIIGEPHMGKTYTAFYILWEYYQKEFEIRHITHDELINLLQQYNKNMRDFLIDLFASEGGKNRIIHFDDPFGETTERRTDVFAKELNTFLDLIHEYEHLRIIVTSRLNIFEESVAEIHGLDRLKKLEEDIRVHTSYSDNVLLDVFHRYRDFYKPLWASNNEIVKKLDKQLPKLIPAPHNIEFFVRTSETLTSLDKILDHIETCKHLVEALAQWMAYLPDHEKIFLLWLEIYSTVSILFPDESTSKIDFESAYIETMAYSYRKKLIRNIPEMAFERTKEKFDRILLENRDKKSGKVIYDFVHPSYHEAIWHAINESLPLQKWWELIKENSDEILVHLDNKIDLVQFKMIERYGKINRDLPQLLFFSARSEDIKEQFIALAHMLRQLEEFKNFPDFHTCIRSIAESKNLEYKFDFLLLIKNYFDKLPSKTMILITGLLLDEEPIIRREIEKIILKHFDELPKSVKKNKIVQLWKIFYYIAFSFELPFDPEKIDTISNYLLHKLSETNKIISNKELSQKKIIENLNILGYDIILQDTIDKFLFYTNKNNYYTSKRLHLKRKYKKKSLFKNNLFNFIISEILKNYDKLTETQKMSLLEMKSSKKIKTAIRNYINNHQYPFHGLPDIVLVDLLSFSGYIQYMVLPALLIRYDMLSKKIKSDVDDLINDSPDWWIGGSIGLLTSNRLFVIEKKLDKKIKKLLIRLSSTPNKKVAGSLLAEMIQNGFNKNLRFEHEYLEILDKMLKDSEIVKFAEAWMDNKLSMGCFEKKDFLGIKKHLNNLKKID